MNNDEQLELGPVLRALRRRHDLSQRELAGRAGLPVSTLARIESGEITNPRFRTLERLVQAVGEATTIGEPAGPGHRPTVSPVDEARERARDAGGRHYPAHLDLRETYPVLGHGRRSRSPGTAVFAFELNRAARDVRRKRAAVVARLRIQAGEERPNHRWRWTAWAPGGTRVGILRAQVHPQEVRGAWPLPDCMLCELDVVPAWRDIGVEQRLLAYLRAELSRQRLAEAVTITYGGPESRYLERQGFYGPVSTLSLLRVSLDQGISGPA